MDPLLSELALVRSCASHQDSFIRLVANVVRVGHGRIPSLDNERTYLQHIITIPSCFSFLKPCSHVVEDARGLGEGDRLGRVAHDHHADAHGVNPLPNRVKSLLDGQAVIWV